MSEYRKIADSDLEYLSTSRLFGIRLIELLQQALRDTDYPDVDLVEVMGSNQKRALYVKGPAETTYVQGDA